MIEIVDRFQIQTKIKVFYYYDYRAHFGRDYIAKKYDSILIMYIVIVFQAKRNSRSLFMQID